MTNMLILSFLLDIKFRNFLKSNRNIVTLLSNIFLFSAAIANVVAISSLLNYLSGHPSGFRVSDLIGYCNCLIFSIPILILFIPSYRPKIRLFNGYEPVSKLSRSVIEISYHFFSPAYILLLLCVALLFVLSAHFGISAAMTAVLTVVASSICCQVIQEILAGGLPVIPKIGLFAAFVALSVYSTSIDPLSAGKMTIMIVLLFLFHYLLPYPIPRVSSAGRTGSGPQRHLFPILTNIYFRTSTIKVNLALAFLFKAVFLFVFFLKPQKGPYSLESVKYLFISSLGLFTYIHNNIWGYLKTTYKSIARKRDLRSLFSSYVLLLAAPVMMDCLLSILFLYAAGKLNLSVVSFYFLCLSFYILIGFYSSVSRPTEIARSIDFTNFKPNTPLGFNMLSAIVTIALSILLSAGLFLYFLPFLFLLVIFIYYRLIARSGIDDGSGGIYRLL